MIKDDGLEKVTGGVPSALEKEKWLRGELK